MKIAIILPGFSSSEQDWCIPALLDLVRVLSSQRNVDLHVFPLRYPYRSSLYSVYGASVHPQGGADVRGLSRSNLLRQAVTAIRREHRRSPFDLLHAYWADEPGFVATVTAALLRIPSIVSLAGGELAEMPDIAYGGQLNRANRLMTRFALHRANSITAGSRFLIAMASRHVRDHRLIELPLGVDTDRFSPVPPTDFTHAAAANESLIHIVHVASLVPVKDQATLLNAMALTVEQAPNARLHLVGDGPLRAALHQQVDQLNLSNHVLFHGDVPHDELPSIYRSSDFCVLTSRYEAQGMVVLEAGAVGRATIGTNVGILPEVNCRGVVPVGDVQGMAREMTAMACDASLRRTAGEQAMRTVRQHYSLDITASQLLALYHDILRDGP